MNYITLPEMREIAELIATLEALRESLSVVSVGDFDLYDSNGESLGAVKYIEGNFVLVPPKGETHEATNIPL